VEPVKEANLFSTEILKREWLAKGVLELKLRRPAALSFLPGQFMRFYHKEIQRDYSLISHPDADTMDFCIAIVEGGHFSNTLAKAEVGDTFQLSGPHGRFIYHPPVNPPVFVATGTGIAPFVSFCRSEQAPTAILLHGVGSTAHLVFSEILKKSVDRYIPCVSRSMEEHETGQGIYAGRVTDFLDQALADGTYDFYLCGHSAMIKDAVKIIDTRFENSRLYIERYD
jgi:ferredoxin-NADP reductase